MGDGCLQHSSFSHGTSLNNNMYAFSLASISYVFFPFLSFSVTRYQGALWPEFTFISTGEQDTQFEYEITRDSGTRWCYLSTIAGTTLFGQHKREFQLLRD